MRGRIKGLAIGAAALLLAPAVSDFVQWSLWRQSLQRRADSAALAGARSLRRGEAPEPAARGQLDGHTFAEPPRIEYPPSGGTFAGRRDALRVGLAEVHSPFFHSRLFGPSRMRAATTAAVIVYRDGSQRPVRVE